MVQLKNKSVLITGGTGTVGRSLLTAIVALPEEHRPKQVTVLSRDEYKQYVLQKEFPPNQHPLIQYALADIGHYPSLSPHFRQIDIVIHAAALKRVETGEQQPGAFTRTNVSGTENVLLASVAQEVSQIITISTDKAVYPTTLYGATKLCAERLTLQKNQPGLLKSSVVRLGNILGSRGSVITGLRENKSQPIIKITHPDMTRFTTTAPDCADYILTQIQNAVGGEILIPKTKAYRLIDLAQEIATDSEITFSSPRLTEKIHETLISSEEARFGYERPNDFVISMNENTLKAYQQQPEVQSISPKAYTSEVTAKLSRSELAELIATLV
ncbi:polysaccharide biosynthesis protein [Tunicatimonas pelagia]|uniref:polysaccharide biosynthesis protein n=1 Tax=Tunicatimonas pelagia TaxID=931531 RepID=UPI0026665BCA|nr:polysaccharide biosynthesis protein [Tunicatimonas pelagia]WKN43251.1 polysaccharide biosynthesis protein [Tunicatimonas pelagia]